MVKQVFRMQKLLPNKDRSHKGNFDTNYEKTNLLDDNVELALHLLAQISQTRPNSLLRHNSLKWIGLCALR